MYMISVFTVFGMIAGGLGLMLPHLVHRLGLLMMVIYLSLAAIGALLSLFRRTG